MPHKLSQFWQELIDRRVIRTITVYVAGAFGLMEMTITNGFQDLCMIKMNLDLSSLKKDERFLRLMEQYIN